jgi:serine/threonine protein kinase
LGAGTFNAAYKIQYENGGTYVLRITKPELKVEYSKDDLNEYLKNELYGLFVQSYLHKKCRNHICNVYDFGICKIGTNKIDGVYAIIEYLPVLCEKHMLTPRLEPRLEDGCKYIVEFKNKLLHRVFIGLFTALKCIHENRFAHLDLKPENIGFDEDNNAKLFDFGMATYFPNTPCAKVYGLKGTPLYLDYNSIFLVLFLQFL